MRPVRILVVEDEQPLADQIRETLQGQGYEITCIASSGEEALHKAIDNRPHLVLMDTRLKGRMDGIEAARQIRAQLDAPVVYLSAHADEAMLGRAKETEPLGILLEPIRAEELKATIEMALYRHEMQQKLRESERRFATTLRSIGDAVIATDRMQHITFMNPAAEGLTGWLQRDALGRDVSEVFRIVNEKTRESRTAPVAQVVLGERTVTLEDGTVLISRDGREIPIDDSAAPIKDDHEQITGAVLVFRDITQHRNLEENLRATQKMEAIGRLAGGIAHDFNNLMTVVLACCDLLKRNEMLGRDVQELVQCIHDAGDRATTLTRQLLAYSRKQVLCLEILDINRLIHDVDRLFRRIIGESIDVKLELAPDTYAVRADAGQLQQVLLNLVLNARDAMPDGGCLTVTTSNVFLSESFAATHPDIQPGVYVKLSVQDTGHGMDEETKARVFDPFFTTKDVGKGSGLGLATAYGIVKQSGGHIEVASQPRKGCVFDIYLPARSLRGQTTHLPHVHVRLSRGSETVLLVEDEEAVRRVTARLLEAQGFRVLIARSPDEAIEMAMNGNQAIDLLVTDIVMPGMNGRDLADRLHEMRPDLKVLYLSGYHDEVIARHGILGSGSAFLPKPYPAVTLIDKVREILDSGKKPAST